MPEAKAVRQAKKAEKEAASAAILRRRTEQLEAAESAIVRLQKALRVLKDLSAKRDALASHLQGFYAEIDKLTKGKALIEVTPLMLDQTNEIISDAKEIIEGDLYLDRIKKFVPAGNNPVYPDVLVAMRGVRQSLERAEEQAKRRRNRMLDRLTKARTIAAAIKVYFDLNDEDATPAKDDVRYALHDGPVARSCFFENESGDAYFDFDALDNRSLNEYLSEDVEEDEVSQAGDEQKAQAHDEDSDGDDES